MRSLSRIGALAAAAIFALAGAFSGCRCGDPGAGDAPRAAEAPLPVAAREAPRPNVLLVSLDTLRADHMGLYGYARDTTPNLDAWARRASVFANAHAPANNTLESHLSLFTSLAPLAHGVREIDHYDGKRQYRPLDPRHVTLAERLREAGYRTRAFVYDCYWMDAEFGFDRGFDAYRVAERDAAAMNEELVFPWLEQQGEHPFFLFVHYYDIHSDWQALPYDAPEAFRRHFADRCPAEFTGCAEGACATERLMQIQDRGRAPEGTDACVAGLYDAGVAYVDEQVGKLLSKLAALGLADDTLVVLLADHGEEFREHGRFLHAQLYQEQIHVPWIVSHPRLFPAPRRIDAPVQTLDLAPTLLDLLGLPPLPQAQGRSLLPLLRGEPEPAQPVFSSDWWGHALREGDWKLIDDRWRGKRELYDLRADPAERRDLLAREPERAAQLAQRLDAWVEQSRRLRESGQAQGEVPAPRVPDAETKARLRSLGYVE